MRVLVHMWKRGEFRAVVPILTALIVLTLFFFTLTVKLPSPTGLAGENTTNQPPIYSGSSLTTTQATPLTIDLAPSFSDPEGDELTFVVADEDVVIASISGSIVTLTPISDFVGERTLTIVASDGTNVVRTPVSFSVQAPEGSSETPPSGGFGTQEFTGQDVISGCATINTSTSLTANAASNGTCMTMNADNLFFNCTGFTISFGANGQDQAFGILAVGRRNVTIQDCMIRDINASGAFGIGINLSNTNDSLMRNTTILTNGTANNYGILIEINANRNLVENNTVSANGTGSTNVGIFVRNSSSNILANNRINATGSSSNGGINVWEDAQHTIVRNNTIRTSGSSIGNDGLFLFLRARNVSILSNTITTSGVSDNEGIELSGVPGTLIANNTVFASGSSSSNDGIFMTSQSQNNTILSNTIITSGTTSNNGLFFAVASTNNNVSDNRIFTNGSGINQGIFLSSSNSNSFASNNITTNGTLSYAVQIRFSNFSVFNNTVFFSPAEWINSSGDNLANFTNTTFELGAGRIRYPGFVLSGLHDVTFAKLNISSNRAFVNSTNLSFLNTSAQITLFGVPGALPLVDVRDDGSAIPCPSSICSAVSFAGSTLVFNVTQFTTYGAGVNVSGCAVINTSTFLTSNVTTSTSGTCFRISQNNLTFSCLGFTVTGPSSAGIGINASRVSNITIKDCNVREFSVGIELGFTNRSFILNNTVFNASSRNILLIASRNNTLGNNLAIGSGASGIRLQTGSHGNILENNTGINTASTQEGIDIESSSNNTLINTEGNSTGSGTGIMIDSSSINNTLIGVRAFGVAGGVQIGSDSPRNRILNAIIRGTSVGLQMNGNSDNTTIINVTVISTSGIGIDVSTNGNNISNSTGNGTSGGIVVSGANNIISGSNGTSSSSEGILVSASGNLIVDSTGVSVSDSGVDVSATSNRLINVLGVSATSEGVFIGASSNNFTNVTGFSPNATGLRIGGVNQNIIINSTFEGRVAFRAETGSDTTRLNGTILRSNGTWISHEPGASTLSIFNDLTFDATNGSVNIRNLTLSSTNNISLSIVNITFNRVRVDTSTFPSLNTSGQVTLRNLTTIDPAPIVDPEDDGTFASCPASRCTEISYTGGVFVFNVTGFTTYSSNESFVNITSCPATINTSVNLQQNLTSNTTCITLGADDITLNCNGHSIFYNGNGQNAANGIVGVGRSGVTIRDCLIRDINVSGTFGIGINLTNVSDSRINNNTILTNGTSDNYGILMQLRTIRNLLANNTITTKGTASNNYGLLMIVNVSNNTIFSNTIFTNGTGNDDGIRVNATSNNNAVLFNRITITGGASSDAIRFREVVDNSTVANNNITVLSIDTGDGIRLGPATSGNRIENNTINMQGLLNMSHGIFVFGFNTVLTDRSSNTTISQNTVLMNVTSRNQGIRLENSSNSNLVSGNRVTIQGTADFNEGIMLFQNSSNNTIRNNTISTNGTLQNEGIRLENDAHGNLIAGNTIRSFGSIGESEGILIITVSTNNSIVNNTIITNGGPDSHGIEVVDRSNNNQFMNTNITVNATGSVGVRIFNANNTVFNNTIISTRSDWVNLTGVTENINFTNTTFLSGNGSVRFPGRFTVNGTRVITGAQINISFNQVLVNTTNLTFLNTSAQITLRGITFFDPTPAVNFSDGTSFADCPSTICSEISFTGGVFVYNVTQFTAYGSSESGILTCPIIINESTNLFTNITSNTSCITFGNSSVLLDCNGNNILYGAAGSGQGVIAAGRTNVSIRNCFIRDINATGTFGLGINLTNTNSSVIANNTVITNGTTANYGVFVADRSLSAVIANNTVRTSGNETFNIGIYVFNNASNANITFNNVTTNGTTDNYGIQVQSADNATVANNTVIARGNLDTNIGIILFGNVTGSTVRGNIVNASGSNNNRGVQLRLVSNNVVMNNRVTVQANGSSNSGVRVQAATNNIVANNTVSTNGSGNLNIGIVLLSNASHNFVASNTVTSNGTDNNNAIRLQSDAHNNTVTDNTVIASGSTSTNIAILLFIITHNNTVTNNIINATGTTNNDGVQVTTAALNNTIANNTITTYGNETTNVGIRLDTNVNGTQVLNNTIRTGSTSSDQYGIMLTVSVFGNTIANNVIFTNGTGNNTGIYLDAQFNSITGNRIYTNGTSINNHGIFLNNNTFGTNITNNTIVTSGTANNYGIYLSNASNNTFILNNITTGGTSSYGIFIMTSNSTVFTNTILFDPVEWINSSGDNRNSNFTNTTFLTQNGSIRFTGGFVINGSHDITHEKLNVSYNLTRVNSSNLTFLNTSAQITLFGITFTDPSPTVSFADNGTFVGCNSSQCVEVSFSSGTYIFDVTQFTSYSSTESAAGGAAGGGGGGGGGTGVSINRPPWQPTQPQQTIIPGVSQEPVPPKEEVRAPQPAPAAPVVEPSPELQERIEDVPVAQPSDAIDRRAAVAKAVFFAFYGVLALGIIAASLFVYARRRPPAQPAQPEPARVAPMPPRLPLP